MGDLDLHSIYEDTAGAGILYWQLYASGLEIGGADIFSRTTFTTVFESTTDRIMLPGAEFENMISHLLSLYSLVKDFDGTYFME